MSEWFYGEFLVGCHFWKSLLDDVMSNGTSCELVFARGGR